MIIAIQILLLLTALLFLARAVNMAFLVRWFGRPQTPGSIAIVEGRKCYHVLKGEGSPTIIIEAGLESSSAEWWGIQETLAGTSRVLTYDRAGYGWSELIPGPRTSQRIASELKALLDELGIAPQFVMVGQGLGALYVNHFCRLYPDTIAGVVFVEPISPEHLLLKRLIDPNLVRRAGLDKTLALKLRTYFTGFGFLRIAKPLLLKSQSLQPYKLLPRGAFDALWHTRLMLHSAQTALNEYIQASLSSNSVLLRSCGPFPEVPFRIVSPSSEKLVQSFAANGKLTLQEAQLIAGALQEQNRALAALSPQSEFVQSEEIASHINLAQPELIIQTILGLLAEIRK